MISQKAIRNVYRTGMEDGREHRTVQNELLVNRQSAEYPGFDPVWLSRVTELQSITNLNELHTRFCQWFKDLGFNHCEVFSLERFTANNRSRLKRFLNGEELSVNSPVDMVCENNRLLNYCLKNSSTSIHTNRLAGGGGWQESSLQALNRTPGTGELVSITVPHHMANHCSGGINIVSSVLYEKALGSMYSTIAFLSFISPYYFKAHFELLQEKSEVGTWGTLLTKRECFVLKMFGEGEKVSGVAQRLGISVNTVASHNRNIYSKLGVKNRTQALNKAMELGLIDY